MSGTRRAATSLAKLIDQFARGERETGERSGTLHNSELTAKGSFDIALNRRHSGQLAPSVRYRNNDLDGNLTNAAVPVRGAGTGTIVSH